MKNKALVFSLIAVFVLVLLAGCGPVSVEEVTVCKNVDSNASPIDPTDNFPSGTEIVYVSIKINNMSREDKLTVKWNYLETGEELGTNDFTTDKSGSGYIGFSLISKETFSSGRYNATVYLNNEAVETVEFSVE
jgi:hypothetical protein